MKKVFFTCIIFCLAAFDVHAQQPVSPHYVPGIKIDNDTLPHVNLPEVVIFPKNRFKSKQDEQQYWRLVWKVKKVYPYVKEAARLYQKYQQDVPQGSKRRDRRVYIKKAEDELMALYGPKLKKLSISEGRILIKLIDRETHSTSYDLIDQLKGGVPAVFWQGVARLFGNNLKSQYDPHGEDRQIEQIVMYIEAGIL
ncbi:MAG: DUF4294 domain-containing protein [Prolixibacteraceae bacterium]|nr:DUF4294 domain-containing protein [Prolixibacteraceae bacterium]